MIDGITSRLPLLPTGILQALYEIAVALPVLAFDPLRGHELMLASEDALARIWDTPEEDAAWAHLEHLPVVM